MSTHILILNNRQLVQSDFFLQIDTLISAKTFVKDRVKFL